MDTSLDVPEHGAPTQGSTNTTIAPQLLQDPVVSDPGEHVAPGFWAYILEDSRLAGRSKSSTIPGTILHTIQPLPVVREPTLRAGKNWDAERFFKQVTRCPTNIEALHIQAKGRALSPEESCTHCKNTKGVFSTCVVFEGLNGAFPSCGNCNWSRQRERCSFYKAAMEARKEASIKAHSASFAPLFPTPSEGATSGDILASGQDMQSLQTTTMESREGMEAVVRVLVEEEAVMLTQLRGLESSLLGHLGDSAMRSRYDSVRSLVVQSEARSEQLQRLLEDFGPKSQ